MGLFGKGRRTREFDRGYRDGLERGRPDPSQGMATSDYEDGFEAGCRAFDRIATRAQAMLAGVPAGDFVHFRLPREQAEALVDPRVMRIGSEQEVEREARRDAALATIALAVEAPR